MDGTPEPIDDTTPIAAFDWFVAVYDAVNERDPHLLALAILDVKEAIE